MREEGVSGMKRDTYLRNILSEQERSQAEAIYDKLHSEMLELQYDINRDIEGIQERLLFEIANIEYDIDRDISKIYQKIEGAGLIGMAENF